MFKVNNKNTRTTSILGSYTEDFYEKTGIMKHLGSSLGKAK